ncbi:hypothetical protein LV83_03682 [Algoriphagus yeomjeoni]|uniref:Uncharacterized protein n=2 Tax=Algoriphagus yeomjeoni TaxID=291403 RepID=A0A327P3Z0_9BACT|nr:hypothetical protein LV83_03682 [Algoriphagus yeomjeoni]
MVVLSLKGRIKWYWYSHDFPYKWLKHGKAKVPDDTVAGEYYSKNRSPKQVQDVFAIDWFNYVQEYDTYRKFYEQCLFYKGYVLSIIWED